MGRGPWEVVQQLLACHVDDAKEIITIPAQQPAIMNSLKATDQVFESMHDATDADC